VTPVPEFLHQLTKILKEESKDIIEWSNGQVVVHDPPKLASNILHKYFRHSKYSSFQRQMNYFGFRKIAGKGKLSPCSYVNDSTTSDMRSLLFIKRRPCSRASSSETNDNSAKRKADTEDLSGDLKNTKKPRRCSDFQSETTSTDVIITHSFTPDISTEGGTFQDMIEKSSEMPPFDMDKPIAVSTLGQIDPDDSCALMPSENTMAFALRPFEYTCTSHKASDGDTSFDAVNFCASLNSTIQHYKQHNQTDEYAGQCIGSDMQYLTPHSISWDQNDLLLCQIPSIKSNSISASVNMSFEPTPICDMIFDFNCS